MGGMRRREGREEKRQAQSTGKGGLELVQGIVPLVNLLLVNYCNTLTTYIPTDIMQAALSYWLGKKCCEKINLTAINLNGI